MGDVRQVAQPFLEEKLELAEDNLKELRVSVRALVRKEGE
jgi:hypothetical protein